jgi:hypothetical protein
MTRLALLRRRLGMEPGAVANDSYTRIRNLTEVFSAEAAVPTASGSRYLQQLCKHWAHNLTVDFTPEHGTIVFPKDARGADHPGDALVTMDVRGDSLDVRIDATSPEQRDDLKGAVARHLDRFAFREAPLPFDWRDL